MNYDPLRSFGVSPHHPHASSYWRANFTPCKFDTLNSDVTTDVAVIGAGYTGLSAACELARQGQNVTVIDSHEIGFGCAGRNAGFVLSGTGRLSLTDIQKKWDKATALGMQREFSDAVTELKNLIHEGDIDCDLAEGPYYKIAHSTRQASLMQQRLTHLQHHFDSDAEYLSSAQLQSRMNISGAHGATVQSGLALNPLKLIDGYAGLANRLGASIYTQSPAMALERSLAGHRIHTPGGTITAKNLLVATNAYTPKSFSPAVDGRQFPVQSSVLVTAPLSEAQRASTGLAGPMTMMDTRMMKYYYRVLPDGRLLFGGRGAVNAKQADNQSSCQRLTRAMLKSFPSLSGIDVDHFWSGWVSVSLDSLPRVTFDPQTRVGYAMGYCGSGVSFASLAGKRLAQRAMGMRVNFQLPIYQGALPRYPFPAARRLGLRALYGWARVAE
ncbi:FAD-binding oxidoreductase [Alteromonas aestuariivivens]|uniref:FAD-binding oxidoreductase n=1 Tax=Alteromonas aestuariivivens TaxID=1938339 RepID=A0A3D8MDQ7_9ALTE|nr:FAD-binding oxidoreductase [Alteromonas aestuariivivens]RDV28977.1 FAD-binding oxidoreductase [Alteromonas aestuariivivens]